MIRIVGRIHNHHNCILLLLSLPTRILQKFFLITPDIILLLISFLVELTVPPFDIHTTVCLELLQLVLLRELSSEAAAHHSTPVPKGTKNKNMLVKLEISVEKTQSSSQKLHGSSNTKSLQVQHTKYIYISLYGAS